MSPHACTYELDPEFNTCLKIYLFKKVHNVEEIRKSVMKGALNCAIVKPSLIMDPLQIAVAANRAVVAEHSKSMVTRTIYTEILFNLSLTKNISQSLSKFGIEKDQELLVCMLVRDGQDDVQDVLQQIRGEVSPMGELCTLTDVEQLKRTYKLDNVSDDELLDVVISRMVTKNFVSH